MSPSGSPHSCAPFLGSPVTRALRPLEVAPGRPRSRASRCQVPALLLLGCIGLGSGMAPALASEWRMSAGAGGAVPIGTGPLQEGVSTGISATASVAYGLGAGFEAAGRFAFSRFPRDDAGVERKSAIVEQPRRILDISGGNLTAIEGSLELHFFPSQGASGSSIHPFVLAGIGVVSIDLEPSEVIFAYAGHTWSTSNPGEQGEHLALALGGGLRLELSRHVVLLGTGRYEIVFRSADHFHSIPLLLEVGLVR